MTFLSYIKSVEVNTFGFPIYKKEIMKKSILTTTLLMAVICLYSQVGINTESPAATLDVKKLEEFDKTIPEGIITPIFTGEELTEKNGAYTSAQMGTIVYVTAPFEASVPANDKTEDVKTPGYYFFNGTKWQAFDHNSWSTSGNKGTDAATNFIGTTDNNALVFKTNNVERMTLTTNNRLDFATSNVFLGGANSSFTGSNNTAVGKNSATHITTGINNTLIGHNAGVAITENFNQKHLRNQSNNILIGANTTIPGEAEATGNSLNIGNFIIGLNLNNNTYGISDVPKGRIGIGIKSPQATLHIGGNVRNELDQSQESLIVGGLKAQDGITEFVMPIGVNRNGVVRHAPSNVIFLTGAAGAVYTNDKYLIHDSTSNYSLNMPDPTTHKGREIYITIRNTGTIDFTTHSFMENDLASQTTGTALYVSNGERWIKIFQY